MDRDTKEYIKNYEDIKRAKIFLDDLLEFINWFQINYEDEELVEEFNELKLSVKFETRKDTDAYYDGVKKARDTVIKELIETVRKQLRKGEQQ